MRVNLWQRWLLIVGEAVLIPLALAAGWWWRIDPRRHVVFTLPALCWGAVAILPMLLGFWLLARGSVPGSRRIAALVDELLVPFFAGWRLGEMALVAAAAGIGEELFFRGLLQAGISDCYGWPAGLILASVVFGLVHFLTAEYALYAALVGAYLGALYVFTDNLLVPIIAHALYDFVALVIVSGWGRRRLPEPQVAEHATDCASQFQSRSSS